MVRILLGAWWWMLWTPGPECVPPLEALNADEAGFEREVRSDISFLAGTIGERNLFGQARGVGTGRRFYRPLVGRYWVSTALAVVHHTWRQMSECRSRDSWHSGRHQCDLQRRRCIAGIRESEPNAILPFSLAAQTSLQVAVQRFERVSAPVTVTLQDTAPAIFTAAQTGTGQAVVLQQPPNGRLSYNSSNNPVHAGNYLEIFATGQGLWTPPPQSDVVVFSGKLPTTPPVSLTIGGQPATIVYTGPVGG